MKKFQLLLIGLGLSTVLLAQRVKLSEIKADVWPENDPYAKMTDIPDEWTGESAVIIYQKYWHEYNSRGKRVYYATKTRRRIKLLDKSAVEDYSELSFSENFRVDRGFYGKGGRVIAGLKVIKPDGTVQEFDMEDAVAIQSDSGERLKKIAVPDLEPGDILDYFYFVYEPFEVINSYLFEPVVSVLSGEHPIVKQDIEYAVGKKFYINFRSLNDAPELKEIERGRGKKVTYALSDEMREGSDDLRWFYPRCELPVIKFQVCFARKDRIAEQVYAFLGKKDQVKQKVLDAEVLNLMKSSYDFKPTGLVKGARAHLKRMGLSKEKDFQAYIREAYNFYRHQHVVRTIEFGEVYKKDNGYASRIRIAPNKSYRERAFISGFGSFLAKEKIPFSLLVTIPRYLGDLDKLLLAAELDLLLRIDREAPIYLGPYDVFTDYNQIPSELEGAMAHRFEIYPKAYKGKRELIQLPASDNKSNKTTKQLEVRFAEGDLNTLSVKRQSQHTGHVKGYYQEALLYPYDYIDPDRKNFDDKPYYLRERLKRREVKRIEAQVAELREDFAEQQLASFEASAHDDLDLEIKTYNSYNIEDLGRDGHNSAFRFADEFELEGLVKRAGRNHVFEVGKLIGGQVALKEDEMERKENIYMPYARSFENQITIYLPEGYTVEGLDNLNMKVENETGGFVSSATVEGNILTLNVLKYYSHNYEKAAAWTQLTAFLEAAYDFTQQKVLLKKG